MESNLQPSKAYFETWVKMYVHVCLCAFVHVCMYVICAHVSICVECVFVCVFVLNTQEGRTVRTSFYPCH